MSTLIEEGDLSPLGERLYEFAVAYYDADPDAQAVDREIIAHRIERELPPKVSESVSAVLHSLPKVDSTVNVVNEFIAMKAAEVGLRLSAALAAGKDPGRWLDEYLRYRDALVVDRVDEEVYHGKSVREIMETKANPDNLIRIYPKALNAHCDGGAMPGHHILVYGRPEAGKTAIVINMVAGFLSQGLRVLYCGNEDPLSSILLRMVGRLSLKSKFELFDDPEGAENKARERGYDNLVLAKLAPGTFREIAELVRKYNPHVVVLDQMRNLKVKSENRTTGLEAVATAGRNLASKHDLLVVSVTQAGDSANNKLALEMGDVDGSNTGIPAQVDLMIGVGVNQEMEAAGQRMLSICKNKLGGWHGYFPVNLDIHTCNVKSIG